ncbi:CHAT domain-containing protein [Oscillochloris sp. ZM17-4]|uniref:CHAT domain-containing protein n=1 Tax=Oscillochloris sp. ZM17-4 TaxID=2866714 RepID=UPI001C72E506|nr:CHAT domain-containing protein [Oscillochloris sp. ZM17-4]MBX0329905.1 CHAT domain-containing protein [Oscillochloris sp. ZM17-4]
MDRDPTNSPPPRCTRILTISDRHPRCAVGLAGRLLAATTPDHPNYAWAQLTLGWCLVRWEDLPAPVRLLQQAEATLAARGARWGALTARTALLLAALLQRGGADLLGAWDQLASDWESAGWPIEAARVRISQMRTLNTLGRPYEALALATSITPLITGLGTPADHATLTYVAGTARLQASDFPAATALLGEAAAGFRQLRQPAELAKVWFEQARVAFFQDDFYGALALHTHAQETFTRLAMPLRAAVCTKNMGAIWVKLGQADRAISTLLAARTRMAAIGQPYQVADCDLNLGNAAYHSGLYDLALGAWRRTEVIYTQLGAPGMALISRRNQAEAYIRLGQLDSAESLLTALVGEATQIGAHRDLPEILQGLGEVLHARGEPSRALGYLQEAEALFAALPNHPAAARARLAQGWLHLDGDDLPAARGCFQQAAQDLVSSPLYHWRAIYGLGRCADAVGEPAQALGHYQRASVGVATLRHALANSHASSALFREAAQLFADAIRLAAAGGNPRIVLQLSEQQRALALQQQIRREPIILPPALRADYEARRARMRTLVDEGADGTNLDAAVTDYIEILLHGRHYNPALSELPAQELDLATLRATLSARYGNAWTALIYVSCGDDLLALSLDAEGLDLTRTPLDRSLRRMLDRASLPQYRAYTYQDLAFQSGKQAAPWADLATLGERLIPPAVRARLNSTHRLLIVPGGPLHSLPWAALRVDDHWLVERAVIQLLPSLQSWPELARRTPAGGDALLIGVSQFAGRAAALPSAIPSLDLVQRHWPKAVRRMEDGTITRAQLRTAAETGDLQRYGLIHMATHGQQVAGRGLLAHLKLANDDLLVDEVADLRLGGALVVLVACEGAVGETLPGEELLSLSRALLAAGASDVIASLWHLYDLMVLPLLEPLYAALAAGMDAPTALAEAQRACIAAGREGEGNLLAWPIVWASLCALGAGAWALAPAGGATPTDVVRHQ